MIRGIILKRFLKEIDRVDEPIKLWNSYKTKKINIIDKM